LKIIAKYLLGDVKKKVVMVDFNSLEEFESSIDIEKTTKDLYQDWLSTQTPIRSKGMFTSGPTLDWLPTVMYTLGLAHYGIVLFIGHIFPYLKKKGEISDEKAEILACEFVDRIVQIGNIDTIKFQKDAEALKKAVREEILKLSDASTNLESVKEILYNKIYSIISAEWSEIRRDLVEYIIDAELRRFREIKA
jgi:hypothetical protein